MTWVLFCRIVVSLMLSSSLLSFVGSRLLSDATLCVLSDLQFSSPRRPDKSRQRRIRHRLSDATLCVLSDLQFSAPRRPDKSRQRRIRHRLSDTINGRFLFHLATGKQVVELLFVLVVVEDRKSVV